MINTFKEVSELLTFNSDKDFYFLQIIQRKKDNKGVKGTNNNSRVIKTYLIKSKEYLLDKEEEIIGICDLFNARAGLNLNKRNFEKCALQTARLILDQISNKDYEHAQNAFFSVCGRYSSETDKKWILDVDDKDIDPDKIINCVNNSQPIGEKLIINLPTKNGYHLITKPFAINDFNKYMHEVYDWKWDDICSIHKNNPINLYIP